MEQMIDKKLIKKLRTERSWSQDHLAVVSGLSLRTIQRIENDGTCSLESRRALAAVFEIHPSSLDGTATTSAFAGNLGGRTYGFSGAIIGVTCAYGAIGWSLGTGGISAGEAGGYFGVVGLLCGISCAAVGIISNRYCVSSAQQAK